MSEENKLIRAEFRRMLDKLIDSKIRPTATEIISVEQPLICLFEEVMYKLENQQKEIEELKEKNKELDKENQGLFELYNFNDSSLLSKILKDYKKIIAKQQKEIEVLKEDLDKKVKALDIAMSNPDYICKDKIRAKIKELEITRNSSVTDNGFAIMSVVISNFKELLEENK